MGEREQVAGMANGDLFANVEAIMNLSGYAVIGESAYRNCVTASICRAGLRRC